MPSSRGSAARNGWEDLGRASRRLAREATVVAALVAATGSAVAVTHPTAEDIVALSGPADLRISPDGRFVAYTLATQVYRGDAKPSEGDKDAGWTTEQPVWTVSLGDGAPLQLTRGKEKASSPRWSPDGRDVAFLRRHEGKTRIHVIPLGGGEAMPIPTGDLEPGSILWSPDGKEIAFTAAAPEARKEKDAKWRSGGVIAFDQEWHPARLWVVPRVGGQPRRVTRGEQHVIEAARSPDGKRFVVATSAASDPYEVFNPVSARIVSTADGAPVRSLTDQPRSLSGCRWSPDGKQVAYMTTSGTLSMMNALMVCPVESPVCFDMAGDADLTIADYVWSADSKTLIVHILDRTGSKLCRMGVHPRSCDDLGFTGRVIEGGLDVDLGRRTVALLSSSDRVPADPTVFDLESGKWRAAATLNPQVGGWPLGRQEDPALDRSRGRRNRRPAPGHAWRPTGCAAAARRAPSRRPRRRDRRRLQRHGPLLRRPRLLGVPPELPGQHRLRPRVLCRQPRPAGPDRMDGPRERRGPPDRRRQGRPRAALLGRLVVGRLPHQLGDRPQPALPGRRVGCGRGGRREPVRDERHQPRGGGRVGVQGQPVASERELRPLESHPLPRRRHDAHPDLPRRRGPPRPFGQSVTLYRALRDVGCPVKFYAYPGEPHGLQEPAHQVHRLRAWADWYDAHLPRPPARCAPGRR